MSTASDLRWYRGDWPDPIVPSGEPSSIAYEIDVEQDNVLRRVEIFPCGRSERSIAEDGAESLGVALIHAPFIPMVESARLQEMTRDGFELLWRGAEDRRLSSDGPP